MIEKTNYLVDEEKIKAAYALNLCTVSVSQIIDYNDVYILEQEYDAILNNLNLEQMPKDEALLTILTELLNVITFFRIQEIKKEQLDKKYQQRMKNAIWSAIPNLSVVVSGSPVAMAMALATQVGIGYMNYRKEKANILTDREKDEIELQITAIEQFNALQRELFTTAWRLADKYEFPDKLRLTEKQIKQYNIILMDKDEFRKYARLEAIHENFMAYPPFWYHYAHTALSIATSTADITVKENYLQKARVNFEKYLSLNQFNLLREDQLSASAYLEYAELLFLDESPDYEKIAKLIDGAVDKAGTANDVLQMCALSYLRAGKSEESAKLFKILVNEDYNAIANAKILSRIYVSEVITSKENVLMLEAYSNYKILETRIDTVYLYPMPIQNLAAIQDAQLEKEFISTQKALLKKAYRNTLDAFAKQKIIEFNAILPAPFNISEDRNVYYSNHTKSCEKRKNDVSIALNGREAEDYVVTLSKIGFMYGYIDVLNDTVSGIDELVCFKMLDNHDRLISLIEKRIRNSKTALNALQNKMENGTFNFNDYLKLVNNYSYRYFTEDFYSITKEKIMKVIENAQNLKEVEEIEFDLSAFCRKFNLPTPDEYIHTYKTNNTNKTITSSNLFFAYDLIGKTENGVNNTADLRSEMLSSVKNSLNEIIIDATKVSIYFIGDKQFETYLKNDNIEIVDESIYLLRQKAFAIIDDKTKKDHDLILSVDGVRLVSKNTVRESIGYNDISYARSGETAELKLGYPDVYSNKNIQLDVLKGIIDDLNKFLYSKKLK